MIPSRTVALGVLFLASPAFATVIDDFSVGPLALTAFDIVGEEQTQTGLDPAAVLGGTRRSYVGSTSGAQLGANLTIDTTQRRMLFESDPKHGGYFQLEYGSVAPLNVDLTADGGDRFVIEFSDLIIGPGPYLFNLRVISKSQGAIIVEGFDLMTAVDALSGSGTVEVPFSAFTNSDLTQVHSIRIAAARFPVNSQLAIRGFSTIPEPGSLSLLVGLSLLAFRRPFRKAV